FGGALDEVRGELLQRVARGLLGLEVVRALVREARAAFDLRDAVREVVQNVQARDALASKEVDGLRVGRLEERGEDVPAVNLLLPGAFGLQERVLDYALEGRRVLWQRVARLGHGLHPLLEEALQLFDQSLGAPAAV